MKRVHLIILALLATVNSAFAIPADKSVARVQQPDGSYVSIRLHGDEYLHFRSTDDGYTVVKNAGGYYVYATLDTLGQLSATAHVAHEASARDTEERTFLKSLPKMVRPAMTEQALARQALDRASRARRLARQKANRYDYSKFRGLILLVEYSDKSFKYANYRTIMDEMANKENYTGNSITNISSRQGVCTGSVRDFYRDCSNGLFVPEFDVVGPIKISQSQYGSVWADMQKTNNWTPIARLMAAVADAADSEVDFSKYDGDGDGTVDLVYIIFAGMGSNFAENDNRLLWPHQSDFYNPDFNGWNNYFIKKDGVTLGHYACSTELFGTSKWNVLNGIGTITHEFGHVLGLPDFYDTDYEESGGESHHPGEWTVMAGGGYLNYGRTPATYTLFERYALGWATPTVIDEEGSYTLESLDDCNTGYRMNTRVKKEFFMIENRQRKKWNQYLPGHGMLVFRVDSTNASVWTGNKVNANPSHNYFEMVRAGGPPSANQANEQATDPFPGTKKVIRLDNTTTPANLKTWSGKESPWGIKNIAESSAGVITFDVVDVNILKSLSMVQSIRLGAGTTYQLTVTRDPDYAPYSLTWTSSNESVCTVDKNGLVTGVGNGTATVTVNDNGANRCTAQCMVTVEEMEMADDIATLRGLEEGTEIALKLTDTQVLMAYSDDIFLRDASGWVVLTGSDFNNVKTNDVLNGTVFGRFTITDGMAQLQAVEGRTQPNGFTVTAGEEPQPRAIYLGETTEADYGDLLTLKAAQLQNIDGKSGLYVVEGKNMARVYNTFGLKLNTAAMKDLTKRYDITGILLNKLENGVLTTDIAMTKNPVVSTHQPYVDTAIRETATARGGSDRATVYSSDGRLLGTVSLDANGRPRATDLPPGLYIIKTGSRTWKTVRL